MTADLAIPATTPFGGMSRSRVQALYLLLGFSAGLPFYMFNAVLTLRLAQHGIDIAIVGFFAWIALLPTFKFLWAPLLERFDVPGFTGFWGRRRGWLMLAQLGIVSSMVGMAATADDASLPLTALFAVTLAFWTTTLEIAADGWRIELAPTQTEQGPVVAANLWGYRSAMVAAGSGAAFIAARADWAAAYLGIALLAFLPFPILAAMRAEEGARARRVTALGGGLAAGAMFLLAVTALTAVAGWAALSLAAWAGIDSRTNVTPWALAICMLPFIAMALALPRIRRMGPDAPWRRSATVGPYVDIFWRFGFGTLAVLAFVSLYRVGDVLALTLSHPLWDARGYSLDQIGIADGFVALPSSMLGVALGGWMAAKWPLGRTLAIGAVLAAAGNLIYAWLWWAAPEGWRLYCSVALDQFGNGFAGTVFVVYLSMLVNPRFPAAQYAFLSGFAFLLARLLAGASGTMQKEIGYDGFFILSGAVSLVAIVLIPVIVRVRARQPDVPA
ncbi:muropeptide transporter [Tsuneonella dongtanensis]|uniref:Muropeptide transporter n=1 Tax=Tsuneonella dongtanensis TaxID=692370 RepID=A0A1B2AFN7_9SPHN|nr:permease [Tsuneonella dongtanensis]ANY20959.1 muropeptide transporter [Tsuneonella dongtanensis]